MSTFRDLSYYSEDVKDAIVKLKNRVQQEELYQNQNDYNVKNCELDGINRMLFDLQRMEHHLEQLKLNLKHYNGEFS